MSETESKKHPASAHKLNRLRDDGTLAQARDMSAFLALALGSGLLALMLPGMFERATRIYEIAFRAGFKPFETSVEGAVRAILGELALLLAPLVALMAAVSIVSALVHNNGFVFAMKQVAPDLQKISPMAGLQRIFGKRGWLELAVSALRVGALIIGFWMLLYVYLPELLGIVRCGISCAPDVAVLLFVQIIAIVIGVLVVGAILDVLVQRYLFLEEQKMTDTELKRETKEQFGSPEARQERRRLRNEAKRSAGTIGVDKANMCFFDGARAVALRYHPEHAPVPRVAAKGTGAQAEALRAHVRGNQFPELEHARLTEACFRTPLGSNVEEAMFLELATAMKEMFS